MPTLKTIVGHTSARGICRYLTRKNRALASDYINIDVPEGIRKFDWAEAMDATRRSFGNDLPWRGKRARTYKHYVVSPDPKDGIALEALRDLAISWAQEHFSEYEVAIVYHDDNERGIPHAHVVVNNTNIETGRRLQDPDPKALAASLQELAESQGLTALRAPQATGVAARAQRRSPKRAPETFRSEYVRRAEQELTERGEYSWTADIRARVRIARTVSRSEAEFRSILGTIGVTVADNSPKAERRDWIYALASHPSRSSYLRSWSGRLMAIPKRSVRMMLSKASSVFMNLRPPRTVPQRADPCSSPWRWAAPWVRDQRPSAPDRTGGHTQAPVASAAASSERGPWPMR